MVSTPSGGHHATPSSPRDPFAGSGTRRLPHRQPGIRQRLQRAASPVQHPNYDPYSAYGESNATWRPPVADRNGTIVKPNEPSTEAERPDYEHAPWATGAAGGTVFAPPGTF